MNILLIVSDTLRPEYLGCYGNEWIKTPYIDTLAKENSLFTNCYAASFPTGPMRKDLHLGQYTFPFMSWRDEWRPGHKVMVELFSEAGYETSMVSDTPASRTYSLGFDHFEMIQGQVGLGVEPDTNMDLKLPADPRKLRIPIERLYKIAKVQSGWKGEEDRFVAQTMRAASRWLEKMHRSDKPFFLYVDTFDPHEPWDPPRYYIDQYDPDYKGDELFEPAYEPADYATEHEIRHMRYMYAGEVSLVDRWVGYLLETLYKMGLEGETCVLLTSDHGFYHGEHNLIGKVQLDRDGRIVRRWPLYKTIAHIPLLIRVPGRKGRKLDGFCQPPDFEPTLLDIAGLELPPHLHGRSLLPEVNGESVSSPPFAVSSLTYRQDHEVRSPTSLRTDEYLYIYGGDEWKSEYYDLRKDPGETQDILGERESEARQAHEDLLSFLEELGCPKNILRLREEFNPEPRTQLPLERIL